MHATPSAETFQPQTLARHEDGQGVFRPDRVDLSFDDLRHWAEMSGRLSALLDLRSMLQEVLHSTLAVHDTRMGLLSLCTPDASGLKTAVSAGLPAEFLRCVEYVDCGSGACGTSMERRSRVIVENVDLDPIFAPYRAAAKLGGFRAVHSTPLISRQDKLIGILSVHFPEPHRPSDRETRLLDLYAQQAADLIENAQLRERLEAELKDRGAAEQALRASENRLRLAVEMARLSVYDWNPVTGALNWDARLKAMWGLPADAPVDFEVFMRGVHPADRDYVHRQLARAIDPAGDGIYEAEFRVIGLTDGVERWVMARGQTSFEHGRATGYVGGAMDVTERKRAEERLEKEVAERTAQLAASNAQLEDYVYTIAHDLRAPLRTMQSFAGVLLEDYATKLDATAQDYARRVVRAAGTLDTMVMDLLAYGRVMRADIQLGSVDIAEAVQAAIAQQEHAIRERSAEIIVRPSGGPIRVRAHAATLVQVFANLLSNAVKFVAPDTTPRIEIVTEEAAEAVRVSVRDNGIGIPAEFHEKIFRVFERLHGKTYSGTGVGLAIVRTGVERMGGRVGLESAGGTGTQFWVELPKA
jgi:PAS domain S-box-containing protein